VKPKIFLILRFEILKLQNPCILLALWYIGIGEEFAGCLPLRRNLGMRPGIRVLSVHIGKPRYASSA
jgi:hypothetical protein